LFSSVSLSFSSSNIPLGVLNMLFTYPFGRRLLRGFGFVPLSSASGVVGLNSHPASVSFPISLDRWDFPQSSLSP
jgi:hypothetical protein